MNDSSENRASHRGLPKEVSHVTGSFMGTDDGVKGLTVFFFSWCVPLDLLRRLPITMMMNMTMNKTTALPTTNKENDVRHEEKREFKS